MRVWRWTAVVAAMLLPAGAAMPQRPQRHQVTPAERQAAREALDRFSSPVLARFESEAEFQRYVQAVREVERTRRDYYYSMASGLRFAQAPSASPSEPQVETDAVPPECPPEQPDCFEGREMIFVTGSRIQPVNPSITNNQRRGVEEGDIVKQIDRFLLVLQDGRIFVVDTRHRGRRLALTDRADVYRDPRSDMWYDEMLVFGDRVLITGYSYDEGATEMAAFRLDEGGRLSREGIFRISSNDYYSGNNYATRLIGGNLVTYTPLWVRDVAGAGFEWPVVRRWMAEDDEREIAHRARRAANPRERREERPASLPSLIDAAEIYRPVRRVEEPVVHTVSVCPLSSFVETRDLSCTSTAFVGPERPEWYVTDNEVYLWTGSEEYGRRECDADAPFEISNSVGALLYRVPLSGARPAFVATHGMPPDQFAMQADTRNFYALLRLEPSGCHAAYDSPARLAFFTVPLASMGARLAQAPSSSYTALPGTASREVASRFTDRFVVYGSLSRYRRYPTFLEGNDDYQKDYILRVLDDLRPRLAYAVPIDRPESVRPLEIGHSVIRAERVADDIVLTGYRDGAGLSLSLIDLDGRPRIASTARLHGRYESEGRSHAFNSLVEPDGGGLMGLPTVQREVDSGREYWRSRASDLSFLEFSAQGELTPIGELERRFDYVDAYDETTRVEDEDGVPGYHCEVSCTDWYGNSRPIFTDDRIFALSGTELIEGRIERGRIREVQRLNIALAETD